MSWTRSKTLHRPELRDICCLLHGWGPKSQETLKRERNFFFNAQGHFLFTVRRRQWALFGWAVGRRGLPLPSTASPEPPALLVLVKGQMYTAMCSAVLKTALLLPRTSSTAAPTAWGGSSPHRKFWCAGHLLLAPPPLGEL